MKKTFTTTMPDRVGAFLRASQAIGELGANITRVSYNKAVDTHMLFIEVEAEPEALEQVTRRLERLGYLHSQTGTGSVILLEFKLKDQPGALTPVLEMISRFHFNISYISSQENGTPHQYFKMGLFVEDVAAVARFMEQVSQLCPVRVIHYHSSGRALDNTVFYITYAGQIGEKMGLSQGDRARLIVLSNQVMQLLDERDNPPYKTFEYIGKFADNLAAFRGDYFAPRLTRLQAQDVDILLLEPPCGSNTWVLRCQGALLAFDGGFCLYRDEAAQALRRLCPDFDQAPRAMALTHGDVDHCGLIPLFGQVFVSPGCYENFRLENAGESNFRERNRLHAPYVGISKLLSAYQAPDMGRLCLVGQGAPRPEPGELALQGKLAYHGLNFEVYEGGGGHIGGETVWVERQRRLALTGDLLVNLKGFTPEQQAFNRLAPYLMTSVDADPPAARRQRQLLMEILGPGSWLILGGHGAAMTQQIP